MNQERLLRERLAKARSEADLMTCAALSLELAKLLYAEDEEHGLQTAAELYCQDVEIYCRRMEQPDMKDEIDHETLLNILDQNALLTCQILLDQGQYRKVEELSRQKVEEAEGELEAEPENGDPLQLVDGRWHGILAEALLGQDRYDEAEALALGMLKVCYQRYTRLMELQMPEEILCVQRDYLVPLASVYARILDAREKSNEAEELYREILKELSAYGGVSQDSARDFCIVRERLRWLLLCQGKAEEAVRVRHMPLERREIISRGT